MTKVHISVTDFKIVVSMLDTILARYDRENLIKDDYFIQFLFTLFRNMGHAVEVEVVRGNDTWRLDDF